MDRRNKPTETPGELVELVVNRTFELLGEARPEKPFWHPEFRVRWQKGADPNWDMNCGVMPIRFLDAFQKAVDDVQRVYDVDNSAAAAHWRRYSALSR